QQRDAVRAWLARSEPSQAHRRSARPPPMVAESVTRIEGAREASESRPKRRPAEPVTGPALLGPSREGERVSSVSSATLEADTAAALVAAPRRARRELVLATAALVGLGALGLWWVGGRDARSSTAATAAPAEHL